jgi:hypothetical protein
MTLLLNPASLLWEYHEDRRSFQDQTQPSQIEVKTQAGRPGFNSRHWLRIFSLHRRFQSDSGAHPDSHPMGTGVISPEVKLPRREADHSPPSSEGVKNTCSYTSTPQYVFMVWCLVKQFYPTTYQTQMIKVQGEGSWGN